MAINSGKSENGTDWTEAHGKFWAGDDDTVCCAEGHGDLEAALFHHEALGELERLT